MYVGISDDEDGRSLVERKKQKPEYTLQIPIQMQQIFKSFPRKPKIKLDKKNIFSSKTASDCHPVEEKNLATHTQKDLFDENKTKKGLKFV